MDNYEKTLKKKQKRVDLNFGIWAVLIMVILIGVLSSFLAHQAPKLTVSESASCIEVADRTVEQYGSLKAYLKTDDIPSSITVKGEKLEINEQMARLDCELVYGDFDDVPNSIQKLVGTEWLYLGYSEDGEPVRNHYVK